MSTAVEQQRRKRCLSITQASAMTSNIPLAQAIHMVDRFRVEVTFQRVLIDVGVKNWDH